MKLLDLLGSDDLSPSLKPLSGDELRALEALFIEKGDKAYFRCPVRKKDIVAKPEEAIRQLWIVRLTRHYGYPLSRLAVEYPITFGRDSSKRALSCSTPIVRQSPTSS
jgi:type I restriction enzyme M protein